MFQTAEEGKIVISLTGHRPTKLAGYDLRNNYYTRLRKRLIRIIERSLEKYPIVECHSGMALNEEYPEFPIDIPTIRFRVISLLPKEYCQFYVEALTKLTYYY